MNFKGGVDFLRVGAHGVFRNVQLLGDSGDVVTVRKKREHLCLPLGQAMRFGNSPAVLIDEVYRSRNFDGSFGRNCFLRRASLVGIAGRGFSRRPCDEEHNDGASVQQRNDRYRNRCLLQQPLFADGSDLAKIELVLGSVLSAVPYLAFFTLEPSAIAVTIAVLAACNVAALFSHQRLANRENRSHIPQRTVPFGTLLATLWKPLLCIAMIGLAAPAIVVISHDSTASMTFVQQSLMVHSENIIAALVLGIAWLGARRETTPTKTFSVLFPIIATALLLFLVLEPPLRIIVPYVSGIAFVVFSMIVMIDSIEVSSKQNLGLTSVYGLFAGLFYCANWLGNFAMEAVREQSTCPAEEAACCADAHARAG